MLSTFEDDDSVFTLKGYIPTYHTCEGYKAHLTYYLSLSQEVAALHARLHHVDIPELMKSNRSWVILFCNMDVYKFLKWPEEWTCRTFIIPERNPVLSRRIVECFDSQGSKVFRSDSLWSVVRMSPDGSKTLSDSRDVVSAIGCSNSFSNLTNFDRLRHFKIDNPTFTSTLASSSQDRDINDHANNISYLSWVLQSIPMHAVDEMKVVKLRINWSSEVQIGEELEIKVLKEDKGEYYSFLSSISDKAYVQLLQEK